ncbi:YigZ family protein [Epidermidibacterium keratini]|uniref:YigZ family protein n=1 Tax=Epidermidibacterium keratini TaxID=1891644 RepID=A0A7L4YPD8_9ACTN|nr:YigZ family protein [Epidermidibacterium keratini]QHC01016.1 YigZ family protein [Epidermidibacterium keratini]
MPSPYLTVAGSAEVETEVKRSRFMARASRVESEYDAREAIERDRRKFWDARHHCSAFVLGARGEITRSNDDGEPAGTAGAPILQAITGRGLSDVVVVVTRYFGGTLLGAGGLVRAYGDAAAQALDRADVVRRVPGVAATITAHIAEAGKLENALHSREVEITEVEYAAAVRLAVRIPGDREEELRAIVAEFTRGHGAVEIGADTWFDSTPKTT